jgi:hypothetical protein
MGYGLNAKIGIAFQNSFGTAADLGSLHWIPFLSESVGRNLPPLRSENMRGIFDQGDRSSGPATVDGEIEFEAQAVPLGALIKSVVGDLTTVDSSATALLYTHTFKPRTSDHQISCAEQPVTYYKDLDVSDDPQVFHDLAGTLLEISVANGEFLKAKVGFVGGQRSTQSSVGYTLDSGKRWTWDVASVQLGGVANGELTAFNLSVDNGLEAMHTMNNTKNPSRVKRQNPRSVSVGGTLKFENHTELDLFIAETQQAMIVHLANATEVQSGYPEQLTIKIPALIYDEFKPAGDSPGQLEVQFSGTAEYHVGSGTAVEFVLINSHAAY